jgi:hypothetical protein
MSSKSIDFILRIAQASAVRRLSRNYTRARIQSGALKRLNLAADELNAEAVEVPDYQYFSSKTDMPTPRL